ncbi:enhanced disease resistance 2, partial [Striga asiatica]
LSSLMGWALSWSPIFLLHCEAQMIIDLLGLLPSIRRRNNVHLHKYPQKSALIFDCSLVTVDFVHVKSVSLIWSRNFNGGRIRAHMAHIRLGPCWKLGYPCEGIGPAKPLKDNIFVSIEKFDLVPFYPFNSYSSMEVKCPPVKLRLVNFPSGIQVSGDHWGRWVLFTTFLFGSKLWIPDFFKAA